MQFRAIALAIAVAALVVTAALAQSLTFPTLTGHVVDEAGILDAATRQKLEQIAADLEAKSSDQLVIVTLKSLQGTSIEDYGYQLGRAWQIGQKGKNNGVLLIVAPNERRVRIEVGYGLEPTLTDAISSVIVQGSILPRFRANDFQGGIVRGAEDIVQVLTGDAEEYKRRAAARTERTTDPIEMLVIAFFIFMVLILILNALATMRRQSGIPPGGIRRTRNWGNDYPVIFPGPPGGGWGGGFGGGSGGGFSGGGGSFGGGGSSGSW